LASEDGKAKAKTGEKHHLDANLPLEHHAYMMS
jgi:hypothetical protein